MKQKFYALFLEIFTWWHKQTLGVRFHTFRRGELVGSDTEGNRYYQDRKGSGRRWVLYANEIEASRIPAGWRAWLHHTVETPPSQESYQPRSWEKPHQPNLTGTPEAIVPKGSLLRSKRRENDASYQAWKPE